MASLNQSVGHLRLLPFKGYFPPGADFGTSFSKQSILKTRPRTDKLRRMEEVILQICKNISDIGKQLC